MQFSTIFTLAIASIAAATPLAVEERETATTYYKGVCGTGQQLCELGSAVAGQKYWPCDPKAKYTKTNNACTLSSDNISGNGATGKANCT